MDDSPSPFAEPAADRQIPIYPEPLDDPKTLAMEILEAAWSKNAYQTRVLDVARVVNYTDIFVILSGRSDRQVVAIAEAIEAAFKARGIIPLGTEGRQAGTWMLLDFGSVVVHVFEKAAREYYDLEHLWSDAVPIEVTEPTWVQEFTKMEAGYDAS